MTSSKHVFQVHLNCFIDILTHGIACCSRQSAELNIVMIVFQQRNNHEIITGLSVIKKLSWFNLLPVAGIYCPVQERGCISEVFSLLFFLVELVFHNKCIIAFHNNRHWCYILHHSPCRQKQKKMFSLAGDILHCSSLYFNWFNSAFFMNHFLSFITCG